MTAHVVLFGLPDAGKTSLLGALAQAARTRPKDLGGRITEPAHGLDELRRQVYEDQPLETQREIVPYPIVYEPPGGRRDVVLVDCDGRVAGELIAGESPPTGALGRAVADADALLLVVDAAVEPDQIDDHFGEFVRFLRAFRRARGQRGDVAGLPVILVLTKCDRLARPGDDADAWQQRIEQRKQSAGERFRDLLDRPDAGFGSLRFTLAATATRTPELTTGPGTLEPVGVAELFRRAIPAAVEFRDRRARANRRLAATLIAGTGLAAVLAAGAVGLAMVHQTTGPPPLASAVEQYRARDGLTPSARLREPLARKAAELADLAGHPEFERLPDDLRQYVIARREELEAYREFSDRLTRLTPPVSSRGDDELTAIERQIAALEPPERYRRDWNQTEAMILRDKWLGDVAAIRAAVGRLLDAYRELKRDGDALYLFTERTGDAPIPWAEWAERATAVLERGSQPLVRTADRLPGSNATPLAPAVTYATPAGFLSVERARAAWERLRGRLESLRDAAAALGLAGAERDAVLRLAEPPGFTADQAAAVLAELARRFPRYRDWALAEWPDAAAGEIVRAAERSEQRLMEAGRAALRQRFNRQFPTTEPTPERWRTITDGLTNDAEWSAFRELALVLRRMSRSRPTDPVAELAGFLRAEKFELPLRAVRLTIPDDWNDRRYKPSGPWKLVVETAAKQRAERIFRPEGGGNPDPQRRRTTFLFTPEGAVPPVSVKPGDLAWAELPMRGPDATEWKLSWWGNGARSPLYRFEQLTLPPRWHRAGQNEVDGPLVPEIHLEIVPADAVPEVPALLPGAVAGL